MLITGIIVMTRRVLKLLPLISVMALCTSMIGHVSQVQAADADGQLVILNKKTGDGIYPINCSIPFVTSTINFQNDSLDCDNDEAYGFKLENVPSATFFSFHDSPNCTDNENFSFRFKTIQQPTNMEKGIDIEEAGKKPPGSVVVPGVMLIFSRVDEQVGGKLSCVKIERSAVPTP
ncbi:lipoprotein [Pseudomonas cichorii]|nr:lipoprotein [Pseudomonas cichorii]